MSYRPTLLSALAVCLLAANAFAQGNPTGTISGHVSAADGATLPGVTVVATSASLQGERTAVTSENGHFILPFLPPGDYTVSFTLSGFRTVEHTAKVAAAQTVPVDVTLEIATVAESITVTGETGEFAQTAPVASTYRADLVATLPTDRSFNATVLLAPGVAATGPSGNNQDTRTATIAIAGAMSFENLFLINGVVVNENLRGQALPLFIEDAIQETTVTTGAVSAEFGRFQGGVVNAITKSGGNTFSGSFRTTLNNDDWRATTPFGEPKVDKTTPAYEATAGGPVVRDRLWFFGAGRAFELDEARQTRFVSAPYEFQEPDNRFEGKLTWSPATGHTARGSYIGRRREQTNAGSFVFMDTRSLYDRKMPEDLVSLNYTAVINPQFFVEGQYSRREFTFDGAGATTTDLIQGTLLLDRARGSRYWSPTFCSVCGPPEERNNENILVKGSYFWSTPGLGAHTVVFGYDTFNDIRIAENHQSGSDWRILGSTSIIRGMDIFPVFNNNGSTIIQWNPITEASRGTDFRTHSLFVNDTWRVSDRVSLNLGLRYDRNDGKDSADQTVVKDAAWSPRLSVTIDPTGSGVWAFNAGAGRYVAGVASSIADSSSAGGVSNTYQWEYLGPAINTNQSAPTDSLVMPDRALETLFAWFNANGAADRPLVGAQIPGVDTRIGDRLKSPSAWEYTAGVARQMGERANVRADVVYRDYRDFYVNRRDLSTGQVQDSTGRALDLSIIENSNDLERQYAGLNLQAGYRLGSRLTLGGNYTLSKTWGDIDGETLNNGPIPAGTIGGPLFYPEYVERSWGLPVGDLLTDQRHRGRIWATWLVPTSERFGSVTLAWVDRMSSGTPYPALGLAAARGSIVDPGYASPPVTRNYYFSDRDAFHTEGVHNSDAAVNYDFRLPGIGQNTRAFASFHVLNVFNEAAVADIGNIDQTVLSRAQGTNTLQPFNPFTETPVEGTHWTKGPQFGQPISRFAYQLPRQFRVSFGIRF